MTISKQTVTINATPRKSKDGWTIDIEDTTSKSTAKAIQEAIDWEIMTDTMVLSGWTKLDYNVYNRAKIDDIVEIKKWITTQAKGKVQHRGSVWVFEKSEDAEWFTLKWVK